MIKNISMTKRKVPGRKLNTGLTGYIGRVARLEAEGMLFDVRITGQGWAYGHDLFTVQPRNGKGEKVVRASRLELVA